MSESEKVNTYVTAYLNLRAQREVLAKNFEEADSNLKGMQEELKRAMLTLCNTLNVNSLNTDEGTIIRHVKERYQSRDWESTHRFIIENKCPELLERRIAQGNMKQYMAEHDGEGLPPGIDVYREFDITIRKSSK
jgi:hypothetical protein